MKNDSSLTGLAGEYAVAAQMALRGWHASPTIKHFPDVDLIAYHPATDKRLTVQVKTGRRGAWSIGVAKLANERWIISSLCERADIYVLVDLSSKNEPQFSFYVVPTPELKRILLSFAQAKYGKRKTVKPQPCWINRNELSHREEWCEVAKYKDRWELLDEAAR